MSQHARFEADLIEGHKGVTVVLVPFNPEERWGLKPLRLAGRRHGWPVTGKVQGLAFEGYVGERWGRFFVTIDDALRAAANVVVGDTLSVVVAPSRTKGTLAHAREQSKVTTQPKVARDDALDTW